MSIRFPEPSNAWAVTHVPRPWLTEATVVVEKFKVPVVL
jgi:hypothetical protein